MQTITWLSFVCLISVALVSPARSDQLQFRDQELPTRLDVGYAVRLMDMNGDGQPDIVIVDSKRIIWLANPTWQEYTMIQDQSKEHDNVCFAPSDIDGDGRMDFAIGADWQFNNSRSGGTIGWAEPGRSLDSPWTYHPIGEEPTTHRIQFVDLDEDGRRELIVAPLKGRNTTPPHFAENGVRLLSFAIPADPARDPWRPEVITDQLHVVHNFSPTDLDHDGRIDLLVASFEGVSLLRRSADGTWRRTLVGTGDQQSTPSRGASEVKHGLLAAGRDYIATIEPWHGDHVVVYTRPQGPPPENGDWLWHRHVLDDQLKWGHAVWCANLDSDEDQELIIGVRDDKDQRSRRGLRVYDPRDSEGRQWLRHIIDPGSVAIEDLAAGDLNHDGRIDIVAVGRQTHNVKIYWNETK